MILLTDQAAKEGNLHPDSTYFYFMPPYCPEAEDVLKMYCVDQDPEIKDAQLKELERWSEYSF